MLRNSKTYDFSSCAYAPSDPRFMLAYWEKCPIYNPRQLFAQITIEQTIPKCPTTHDGITGQHSPHFFNWPGAPGSQSDILCAKKRGGSADTWHWHTQPQPAILTPPKHPLQIKKVRHNRFRLFIIISKVLGVKPLLLNDVVREKKRKGPLWVWVLKVLMKQIFITVKQTV